MRDVRPQAPPTHSQKLFYSRYSQPWAAEKGSPPPQPDYLEKNQRPEDPAPPPACSSIFIFKWWCCGRSRASWRGRATAPGEICRGLPREREDSRPTPRKTTRIPGLTFAGGIFNFSRGGIPSCLGSPRWRAGAAPQGPSSARTSSFRPSARAAPASRSPPSPSSSASWIRFLNSGAPSVGFPVSGLCCPRAHRARAHAEAQARAHGAGRHFGDVARPLRFLIYSLLPTVRRRPSVDQY